MSFSARSNPSSFVVLVMLLACAAASYAAPADKPADDESAYETAISKRADGVIKALEIDAEKDKASAVHQIVMDQYRALRDWHDQNDAPLKAARKAAGAKGDAAATAEAQKKVDAIEATLKKVHADFLDKLAAHLTPAQVDVVKDQMTYSVVHVTYNAYLSLYPNLKDEEKAQIMAWLIEAREPAMDAGTSDEKHAIFGKYKGRINNYLSKQGYDTTQGKKPAKPKTTAPATQPAEAPKAE